MNQNLKTQLKKRLFQTLIILLGISFISFLLVYLSPTDPVRAMFAASGQIPSDQMLEEMRTELGLNRPFLVQYFDWLFSCFKGDFGTSLSQGKPVASLLLDRLGPTIKLTLLSLFMMILMAIPIGVLSAIYQNKLIDNIMRFITFIQISMPNFWFGLILMYVVGLKLGLVNVASSKMDLEKMLLPAFTLAFAMAGKYARQVRASVLEELNQDYVIGAKSRGVSDASILWKHIIPNATLPLITLLGLSIGSLLGGTAVVEVIFSYPGLGSLAVNAITSMDQALVQGFVLWISLAYMLVNILVDISYDYLDPRIRKGA